ncbi:MAG: VWA domain-containing protein [Xanthomonadales bacterium]|nr:VWA domain-containing protein [Xanthomonadales bacterium]
MNALADFHFLRPAWLLALLVLPLAGLAARRARARSGAWRGAVDAHLLPHLLDTPATRTRSAAPWLFALAWTLACVALAGPAWEHEDVPLHRSGAARVIALELAPTMLAADLKPTRLARARHKINDILDASRDLQTALIGYAGDAFVAAPLTDDVNTVRNLVDALDPGVMPVAGNATGRAIDEARRLVTQAGEDGGEIIVLADAISDDALAAARKARAQGITVSVLGVGTPGGAPVPLPQGGFLQDGAGNIVLPKLDEGALRALADAGGGRYAMLGPDRSDLASVLGDARLHGGIREGDGHATSARFRDRGPWLVLVVLPFALLAFRRGWLLLLVLACLPVRRAEAFSFADLWQRPDQQAAAALAAGDAARARELARDPALRGSAAYRTDDYAAAAVEFARGDDADAAYNEGNALARLGRYEEALAAYDRALAADAGMEDAKANRAAVEDWLKRQSKDRKGQGQKNDGQKKDDQHQDGQQQEGQQQDGQQQEGQQQDGQQQDGQQQDGRQQDGQQQDGQQQEGQQQEGRQQDGRQQHGQQQDGQQQDGQSKNGEQGERPAQASPRDGERNGADGRAAQTGTQARAEQRAQDRKALSQAIDEALDRDGATEGEVPAAISPDEERARERQQALDQWLQRVPDDPGGLLRRKFQLEHERRQRGGGNR